MFAQFAFLHRVGGFLVELVGVGALQFVYVLCDPPSTLCVVGNSASLRRCRFLSNNRLIPKGNLLIEAIILRCILLLTTDSCIYWGHSHYSLSGHI